MILGIAIVLAGILLLLQNAGIINLSSGGWPAVFGIIFVVLGFYMIMAGLSYRRFKSHPYTKTARDLLNRRDDGN